MDLHIEGRTALVTGSSRGIGRAVAVAMAREGANVAICARGEQELEDVADELRQLGAATLAMPVDVTVAEQIDDMVTAVHDMFGAVDILVNNAGAVVRAAPFVEVTDDEWDASLNINLRSCARFSRAVLGGMQDRGWGRIVNVASVAGRQVGAPPVDTLVEYGTTKAAVIALTKYMAEHVAAHNVLVNCICPGPILTPGVWGKTSDDEVARRLESVPMGRLGTVDEIADLILFLSSERCTYITGAAVPIDGGAGRPL